MRQFSTVALAALLWSGAVFAQYAQGPATGSVPSGVVVNTDNFSPFEAGYPGPIAKRTFNKFPVYPLPDPPALPAPSGPEGSNYQTSAIGETDGPPPIVLNSFEGIPDQGNSIPPDPHVAVGPNHIVAVVNSRFRIWDKQGNLLKTINAGAWFASVLPGAGPFDPKVQYDHHGGRWVMVWLDLNEAQQTAHYLLSVSDDSNPLGVWYNWALPSNLNGSTNAGNWADYQGVGYDNQAIYFTSNQFSFSGFYQYVKLRIIGKTQLYNNTGGSVTWTDFWDLRDGALNGMIGIRPSLVFTAPNEYYLLGNSPFSTSTYFVLHRVTNPLTAPAISAVNIPVVAALPPPNASQLGGGTLIEAGAFNGYIWNEPVYRDSALWMVHAVRGGTAGQYSNVRYVRINTTTNLAAEDVAFGSDGFWHLYPALMVDQNRNVAITFSRSATTQYVGAYMSWRLNTDPPGLRPTVEIQAGKANYVKTFGSGRNRWGDYNGISLDPADRNNFWMFTEYAEFPANTWGTWTQGVRLIPFSGARAQYEPTAKAFGKVEAGFAGDTSAVKVFNVGTSTLTVSSISITQSPYQLLGVPTLPANLATYDSIMFRVTFRPTAHGTVNDTITIATNDPLNAVIKIPLTGKGIVIGRARAGVMYATSASLPVSQLYTVNRATAAVTPVGETGIAEVQGLAIRPTTKELIGTNGNQLSTTFYRVSEGFGDVLPVRTIPLGNLRAIAFSASDELYGGTTTGRLYRINLATGDTVFIGSASLVYSGFSFNPLTGRLWASVRPAIANRDRIYVVDTSNGQATLVGATGDNAITPYLAFDPLGNLFGLKGSGSQTNTLISIDTSTAAGTVIGSTGVQGLVAITMRTDSLGAVSVDEEPDGVPPLTYHLDQNYPNPFNPETRITYGIPKAGYVTLVVYNVMGQEVARLVDGVQDAGTYTVGWSGRTRSGLPAASGIYFYSLHASGEDGLRFSDMKKMVLMK